MSSRSCSARQPSTLPMRVASPMSWGGAPARRGSSTAEVNTGNGLGNGSQVYNYNAKVYTDQPTPPAGTYLDNVVLDVGF